VEATMPSSAVRNFTDPDDYAALGPHCCDLGGRAAPELRVDANRPLFRCRWKLHSKSRLPSRL